MASFNLKIKSPVEALARARAFIAEQGGKLTGDIERGGTFEGDTMLGKVKGRFQRVGPKEVQVTIVKKPMLLSDGIVQQHLSGLFK